MTAYTSPHTFNTVFTSDDGNFSSMTKRYVELWDKTMNGADLTAMDHSEKVFLKCAGHLHDGK